MSSVTKSNYVLFISTLATIAASVLVGACYALVPAANVGIVPAIVMAAVAATPVGSLVLGIRHRRLLARRIVILGAGAMAVKLLHELDSLEPGHPMVAGVINDEPLPRPCAAATTWLGPPSELAAIVERVRPARIVVADRRHHLPLRGLLESRAHGVIVEDARDFYERVTGKIAIESVQPLALVLSSSGFRSHRVAEMLERMLTLVMVTIGLALLAPLLAAIAVAIKLESRGPVLFVQDRVGQNDRRFKLLKFRTMYPSSRRRSEWVRDNVGRITPLGRWLRRFRLDELPQLVNVLRGEMNLVGPRPHPTCNRKNFTDHIAYYQIRSMVRPGLTGWAQVRYGYANGIEEETEKMRFDLYYIKNRSLWLDAQILLRTVLVVLGGEGAPHAHPQRQMPGLAMAAGRAGREF